MRTSPTRTERPLQIEEKLSIRCLSLGLVAPFVMIHTSLQIQEYPEFPEGNKLDSGIQAYQKIVDSGILAFWTGFAFVLAKFLLQVGLIEGSRVLLDFTESDKKLGRGTTNRGHILYVITLFSLIVTYPLDVAGIHCIRNFGMGKESGVYEGLKFLEKRWSEHGIFGLYSGAISAFGISAVWVLCVSALNNTFIKRSQTRKTITNNIILLVTFVIMHPLQTVGRLITMDAGSASPIYSGVIDCFRKTSIPNLYSGIIYGFAGTVLEVSLTEYLRELVHEGNNVLEESKADIKKD